MNNLTKRKGFTLIELAIVLVAAGILYVGIVQIMRTSFDTWHLSLVELDIQQKGRAALEEMTVFIRQATSPVTGITPAVGETVSSIYFSYMRDEGDVVPMGYYHSGSALYRVVSGDTSTLLGNYVDSIFFQHTSSYVVKIASFTLVRPRGSEEEEITFERTINIRNR